MTKKTTNVLLKQFYTILNSTPVIKTVANKTMWLCFGPEVNNAVLFRAEQIIKLQKKSYIHLASIC